MQTLTNLPITTQQYLQKAKNFAQDLIEPKAYNRSSGGSYNPHYHTPGYFYHSPQPSLWNYFFPIQHHHSVHHYHHNAKSSKDKKRKESHGAAAVAAFALTAVALGGLYISAAEAGKLANIRADLKKLDYEKRLVKLEFQHTSMPMTAHYVDDIMRQQENILNDCHNTSMQYLTAKGSITAGLGLGVVSCIKQYISGDSDTFLTLGAIGAVVTGSVGWAALAGYNSTERLVQRKAADLLESISNLETFQSEEAGA